MEADMEIVEAKGLRLDPTRAKWRKGSKSDNSGPYCVEVATVPSTRPGAASGVAVRDSTNPAGPALLFTRPEWEIFVDAVLDGELDDV